MGDKTNVESVGALWGERTPEQRTVGGPDRTRLLGAIDHFVTKFPHRVDVIAMRKALPHVWAGEFGHDTNQLIRAFQAATVNSAITVQPRDEAPPQ